MPPLSEREAFKYGFLLRCAEEGLSQEEANKLAEIGIAKHAFVDDVMNTAKAGLGVAKGMGLLGVGAALLGGGALGHVAANATSPEVTVEDHQKRELIEAYKLRAEMARRRRQLMESLAARPKPVWGAG